jgi:hypothetical protein
VLCTNILEPLAYLISGAFIDHVKDWLSGDVENVDDYRVVEVDVVSQVELKSSGWLAVLLAVLAVLCEVFKGAFINVIACLF